MDFHLSIGTDLAAPAMTLFSDRSGYSILLNMSFKEKWTVQSQVGWEKNAYDDIGWNINTKGVFLKLGGNYLITKGDKDPMNQFYVGGKVAYAPFTQDLIQVPIRASGQNTQYVSLGDDKALAYWFEIPLGARVSIWKEKLYVEAQFSTNVLIHSDSELGIDPIIIPNFGRDNGGINFNLYWGVTYSLF